LPLQVSEVETPRESCPLCKSENVRTEYELTGYRIAICSSCGFEYHDGFGGGGGDDGMFSEDYYQVRHHEAFKTQFADYERDPSAPVYRHWLEKMEAIVPKGRILDVGSGLGTFLKIAESRGWKPEGVEISRFAAEFSRRERGLSVFNGDLEEFPAADGSFDVVTFWDSIEHVTHPRENLVTAVRLLRAGGIVLLTTDNFDCLIGDVARVAYQASIGKVRYAMERIFIPANRSYFTEDTFRELLESCGLRINIFEKMEYPLDKIRTNFAERLILKGFYGAAHLLNRQAQVTVVAQKS
jgi:2-polyprenyl-3-methyl-5-hydroxy-6-metoxy-1,4-benzoquinol methylase